jgi:hypothetical protein
MLNKTPAAVTNSVIALLPHRGTIEQWFVSG